MKKYSNQKRIKKIVLYIDALDGYENPKDIENDCLANILNLLQRIDILDFQIESVSKDEAETFELE